jgi:hypothetical protein
MLRAECKAEVTDSSEEAKRPPPGRDQKSSSRPDSNWRPTDDSFRGIAIRRTTTVLLERRIQICISSRI